VLPPFGVKLFCGIRPVGIGIAWDFPFFEKLECGSARGDGIAPVTSATPPDMRFSASGG